MSSKGLTIPVVGMMLVVVACVFFYLLVQGTATQERSVILKGELSISMANDAELTRKILESSIDSIARRATYNLGKIGYGTYQWTLTEPTIDNVTGRLENQIDLLFPHGETTTSQNRTIQWGTTKVLLTSYDDDSFHIKGFKEFIVTDTRINGKVFVNMSFDREIDSSYFKLFDIAREIVDNGYYTETKDELENRYSGLNFTVLPNEIIIEDPDFVVPGTEDERAIHSSGAPLPYAYMLLDFKIVSAPM